MDPSIIAAGASLLGGLFAKDPPTAGQNAFSHVKGIMKASDKFGFNPLTLLGAVSPMGGGTPQNYMGNAIADAGALLADGMAKNGAKKGLLDRLGTENGKLQAKVDAMTLRPHVGGIFSGVGNGVFSSGGVGVGSSAGGGGRTGSSSVGGASQEDIPASLTRAVFRNVGGTATTETPQGADGEDIVSGLVLEGVNDAKEAGLIPNNFEQPYYDAVRSVAKWGASAFYGTHLLVHNAVRPFQWMKRKDAEFKGNHLVPVDWWKDSTGPFPTPY